MARKHGPAKGEGGRHLKYISWELAEKMAKIQCTGEEIASTLNIDYDTLQRRCKTDNKLTFKDWYKKHSDGGKSSLRRSMWKMATAEVKPNPAMAIWLSKQHLDMKEPEGLHGVNETTINFAYSKDELKDAKRKARENK